MTDPSLVFLSYASRDRSVVASVHAALEARGIHAFFDRTSLSAGGDWIDDIASAIGSAQAFVVFAASDTLGRIQRREVQLAFVEQAKHAASGQPYVLIPVLLDGAKEEVFSGFLELFTRSTREGASRRPGRRSRLSWPACTVVPPRDRSRIRSARSEDYAPSASRTNRGSSAEKSP